METGRIVIVTGCPATGKTAAASALAKESTLSKSVHMHTDNFYHFLSKGSIPPWLPESNTQNGIVIDAFLQAAKTFARGGYDVVVDGIIGPWFLAPWVNAAKEGYTVHYIVLRADKEETVRRAVQRAGANGEAGLSVIDIMHPQFHELGAYEKHAIDTTRLSTEETVTLVQKRLQDGSYQL